MENTKLQQYALEYWDMYKEAYNVRPRDIDTSHWTVEQFEIEFIHLGLIINGNT